MSEIVEPSGASSARTPAAGPVHAQPEPVHPTSTLRGRYIAALVVIAVLSIAGQVLVQTMLTTQKSDSRVINLAGRQRMLGQRIVKTALIITSRPESAGQRLRELASLVAEWEGAHRGLRFGDSERGLSGDNSAAVRARFEELEPSYQTMRSAVGALMVDTGADAVPVERLLASSDEFLEGMERIVSLYEQESASRVQRLQRVELALLGLVLLTLLLEGLFVFRPAVRRIRDTLHRLGRSESEKADILRAIPDTLLRVGRRGVIDAAYVPPPSGPGAIVGQPLESLVTPSHHSASRASLEQTIRTGETTAFEYQRSADGGPLEYIEARMVPCQPEQALVILRDISERRRLEKELLVVAEREQTRIGQDLHDGLCQHLAGLAIMTRTLSDQVAQGKIEEARALESDLSSLADLLHDGLQIARRMATGLFPEVLVERGLAAALQQVCVTATTLHKVTCTCDVELGAASIEQSVRFQLYRIAQEAIGNAIRHGQAGRIELSVRLDDDHLLLRVVDDGVGLPAAGTSAKEGGIGLRSMAIRARMIGAELVILDRSPDGVEITCRLPLDR